MQCDILIVFKTVLAQDAMGRAKTCLMEVAASVLVHQPENMDRVLLVKFDPSETGPSQLLNAVRAAGFDATMAGS